MKKSKISKSLQNNDVLSILIDGPGRGNNVSLILDELNKTDKFEIVFLTENYSFSKEFFSKISVIDYWHENKLYRRIKLIYKLIFLKKVDILYILGGSSLYNLLLIVLFGKYKKLVFNIWSEYIINDLNNNNFKGFSYRFILRKTNKILCNWYGTYKLLNSKMPELKNKAIVLPWGLPDSYFLKQPIKSSFILEFLNKIPTNKIVLLNTRSISEYNNIEELLESLILIKKRNGTIFTKLLLILWHGNNVDINKENYIYSFISKNQMHNQIWYIKHPFVSNTDIRHVIERSHIILNLVKHDQLSISILEGLYLGKEMISSDIEPYRILNSKYNLKLNLIENTPKKIAEEIEAVTSRIERQEINYELIEHRKHTVLEYFRFSKNIYNINSIFNTLLN